MNNTCRWPGVKQIIRLRRERDQRGQWTTETVYFITSLSREKADAKRLLQPIRDHWAAIENRTHWVRDVVFGEDACRIRSGQAPHNLAALRNAALNWLRSEHLEKITANLRHFTRNPQRLLAKLGIIK